MCRRMSNLMSVNMKPCDIDTTLNGDIVAPLALEVLKFEARRHGCGGQRQKVDRDARYDDERPSRGLCTQLGRLGTIDAGIFLGRSGARGSSGRSQWHEVDPLTLLSSTVSAIAMIPHPYDP